MANAIYPFTRHYGDAVSVGGGAVLNAGDDEVVIEDDEAFAAGLGNPVQADVDAEVLGDVVVLNEMRERQRRGEDVLDLEPRQAHGEVSGRQLDVGG